MQHSQNNEPLGEVVRHLPLRLATDSAEWNSSVIPAKDGMKNPDVAKRLDEFDIDVADLPGERGVYVCVRAGSDGDEVPVFAHGADEAVPIFSSRESATLYLQ